jgi:hypothetical protein
VFAGSWPRFLTAALIALTAVAVVPRSAPAQSGFFSGLSRLFGGGPPQNRPTPASLPFFDPFDGMRTPETPREASPSPYAHYCVRLCDGRYFPVTPNASMAPAKACSSLCPAAKTKIFSGAGIAHAAATDGSRYADLESAFVYRTQMVERCSCNAAEAIGMNTMDVMNDPTLKRGDIVATKDGFVTFTGSKNGTRQTADFTPIEGDPRLAMKAAAKPVRSAAKVDLRADPWNGIGSPAND